MLAEASSDRVVLLLKLPEEVVGLRREQRAKLTKIDVTCTPTTGACSTSGVWVLLAVCCGARR